MSHGCLIVTDMDGTLLDHHDYEYSAVLPLMKKLESAGIPVILNTSKTAAELRAWIEILDIRHPFIVENGSAVFIPEDYFPGSEEALNGAGAQVQGEYRVIVTGETLARLKSFKRARGPGVLDLTECSLADAMEATGLGSDKARQAQDRQYSIPLQFDDPEREAAFADDAGRAGYGAVRGGRFLHHMGATNKGRSMLRLLKLYECVYDRAYRTIALGDSPNDLAMLEAADVAVVVQSPSSERLNPGNASLIRTRRNAPEGWVEGVEKALARLSVEI